MNNSDTSLEKKLSLPIKIISVLIPVIVAVLLTVRLKDFGINVEPLPFLPPIYAMINAITAGVLILGVMAIKKGNRTLHQRLMTTAIALSVVFLVLYIAYHLTTEATKFGGESFVKYIYFFILITHILLSIVVVPLVMITYVRALSERFDAHKKIAKITFPIWLYVAISGVVVYIMIAPYYV